MVFHLCSTFQILLGPRVGGRLEVAEHLLTDLPNRLGIPETRTHMHLRRLWVDRMGWNTFQTLL